MSSVLGDDDSDSEVSEPPKEEEPEQKSATSSSGKYYGDTIDFDSSSMKCFKEVELSSSSLFKHPLYFFPELEDPGIFEAFRYEPPLEIDNDVGRERYLKMCKQLSVVPLKRVLESLDQECLDLRYYGLRHNELRAIFHTLEMNAYVKILLLQDSWMEEESVLLLSNMLTHNESIITLDLKQCEIGAKGALALSDGLQTTLTLRELDLSHNSIEDNGLRNLRSAFRNNESLKKINLGYNNLTSASATVLQQFFTNHDLIEDVNLEWNTLCDDEGFKKIAAGLRNNPRFKSLNLAWNSLNSIVVAKELAKFIKESPKLEFLDLSNNSFKGPPAEAIRKAVASSLTLKHFKFGNNPLSVEETGVFGMLLIQRENIKTLDLENLYFNKSFKANLKKIQQKPGKKLIYGGVLGDFKIKGPDIGDVLLKRCHYLGLAPKKAKAKRDFGHIALTFPEEIMDRADFEEFIRMKKKGKMFDLDLLAEMEKAFASTKTKVDTKLLLSHYMKLYPDTALPPPKTKKGKKGALSSGTETSVDTNPPGHRVSFTTPDQLKASETEKKATKEAQKTKTEAQKNEENRVDDSGVEGSKGEDSKVEDSKVEDSKVEDSKVEDSKVEDSKVEDSKVEDSKMEDSKVEDSKVEDSKVEDSKVEESKVEDSKVEESKAEEVKTEEVEVVEATT